MDGVSRLDLLQRMLEKDPQDAFCRYGLAHEYVKVGRFDEAIRWFDAAIEADKDYCYAYYHKAKALLEGSQRDTAAATLRAGLVRAEAIGDAHAAAEIHALLDEVDS